MIEDPHGWSVVLVDKSPYLIERRDYFSNQLLINTNSGVKKRTIHISKPKFNKKYICIPINYFLHNF